MNENENGSTGGTGWSMDPVQIQPITITGNAPSIGGSQSRSYSIDSVSAGISTANDNYVNPLGDWLKGLYREYKADKEYEKNNKRDRENAEWSANLQASMNRDLFDYQSEKNNAEWERRFNLQNKYNEGWADRLRKEGYNPLFQLSKGQAGAMASSNPSPVGNSINSVGTQPFTPSVSVLQALANIRKTEAETSLIDKQANAQTQRNVTYWEEFRASMDNLVAQTRNEQATARINEATANFKEATLIGDIEKASYELKTAFHEMRVAGISVEQGRVELQRSINVVAMQALEKQLMSQQITLNGKEIDIKDLNYRDLCLTFKQHEHLVDAETRHKIAMMGEELERAQKANNWYAVDKIVGGIGTIGNTVANVANAFKPFPQVISSTTTTTTHNSSGEWATTNRIVDNAYR